MIIQAYGLEALVAEKVFHLLLFPNIKKLVLNFHILFSSLMPCWEKLTHMVRDIPTPTGERGG